MTIQTTDNKYGVAKWIVDPVLGRGTHTTIAAALTSASSGETIFIRPGTYTENLTLKAGVDLVSFVADASTPNVTISGNATASFAGTASISGICLQTNSAACLTVSGSSATVVNLRSCFINCTNSTGITYSSSSASSQLVIEGCKGDLTTTGIAYITHSSAGFLKIQNCRMENSGGSSTANSISAGSTNFSFASIFNPFTFSSTASVTISNSFINTKLQNATCITTSNTAQATITVSTFESGTASALSIGAGTTINIENSSLNSTNTNAITGAGTIIYSNLGFGSSLVNNVTTQSGGTISGSANTTPSAGFLGEAIRSFVPVASAVALTTATTANVTSISLTAGVWNVSSICALRGTLTGTRFQSGISSVSATLPTTFADNVTDSPTMSTANADVTSSIPSFRVLLTSTTTYYLVAQATFTVGTASSYGRISATRVG